MKNRTLLFICLLLLSNLSFAQLPTWTASLGSIGFDNINYIKKAGTSTVLICSKNKIFGVSSKLKKIVWEHEINSNFSDSTIKVHEGTPFVTLFSAVGSGKNSFFFKSKYILLNSETGKIVYSNEGRTEKVMSETFLAEKNALLTVTKEGSGAYVSSINLVSGVETWRKNFNADEAKPKGLLGSVMQLAGIYVLMAEMNNNIAKDIILYNYNDIYCLDGATGKQIWKKSYDKRITNVVRSNDLKYLFVKDIKLTFNYLDVATGKEMLQNPVKEKADLLSVDFIPKGYLIKTTRGINLLNDQGTYVYKDNIGSKYQAYEVTYLKDGYVISNFKSRARIEQEQDNLRQQSGNNAEIKPINNTETIGLDFAKFDFNGKKIWDKSISQSNTNYIPLFNGILVITEGFAAMYDYSNGALMWPSTVNLVGETSFGYDYDNALVYAFNRNKIESFSLLDGTYKNIRSDFKFKDALANNDQVFIEPIGNGIFLNSNQNYALIDKNGQEIYNKSLVDITGISKRLKNKIGLASNLIGLVGIATQVSAYTREFNNGNETDWDTFKKRMKSGQKMINISNTGDNVLGFLNSFDKESSKNRNTLTILSNDGRPCAVVIDKATGAEIKRVKILDPKPILYVDEAVNTLYVITSIMELKVFDLNN